MSEIRTFQDVDIRATVDDGVPSVTLQAIKPGVVDDYGSLWKAAAFDESLTKRMPVLCWAHDWADPLGRAVEATPGRGGPRIRFQFSNFDAVPSARRAHAQVMDGTIGDCSVGFSGAQRRQPTDDERSKYPGIREVIESADLDEVSLVLRGAVPGAKVLSVRSVRVASGQTVDQDFVLDLARKIAGGEITAAEAKAAVELVSTPGETSEAGEGDSAVPEESPEPVDIDVQNAEIDAALAGM